MCVWFVIRLLCNQWRGKYEGSHRLLTKSPFNQRGTFTCYMPNILILVFHTSLALHALIKISICVVITFPFIRSSIIVYSLILNVLQETPSSQFYTIFTLDLVIDLTCLYNNKNSIIYIYVCIMDIYCQPSVLTTSIFHCVEPMILVGTRKTLFKFFFVHLLVHFGV